MDPDFSAFQQYLNTDWNRGTPFVVIPATGRYSPNYLIINAAQYNSAPASGATPEQIKKQDATRAEINQALLTHFSQTMNKFELAAGKGEAYDRTLAIFSKHHHGISEWLANPEKLGGNSGRSFSQYSVFLYNDKVSSLELNTRENAPDAAAKSKRNAFTSADEYFFDRAVRHHEAAHMMLDLNEAGADFVSAALLLKENPNSEKALRARMDIRNVSWPLAEDTDDARHGMECAMAINYALNMNRDELKNMTWQQIYDTAKFFDRLTQENSLNPNSGQAQVRAELRNDYDANKPAIEERLGGTYSYNPFSTPKFNAVANAIRYTLPYEDLPQGSAGDKLANSMRGSYARLDQFFTQAPSAP